MTVGLRRAELPEAAAMAGFVLMLHLAGFGLLLGVIVPAHLSLESSGAFGVGIGLTAYTLGMRHAFDADHISAIDNVTRKLMADGQRPVSVGFWFSLGHSSVVLLLACALAAGIQGLGGAVDDDRSLLHEITSVIGPSVSGGFLLLIGLLNLGVLASLVRGSRQDRHEGAPDGSQDAGSSPKGLMTPVFGRFARAVQRPWQMFPLGFLFGLGFDTATEIALLATAGSAATSSLPFVAIVCLPVLFAAGMSLLDTLDGVLMRAAYEWALERPDRRAIHNIAVTGLSALAALLIGTIELAQVLADQLTLTGGFWERVGGIDLGPVGYVIVGVFLLTWLVMLTAWRFTADGRRTARAASPSR